MTRTCTSCGASCRFLLCDVCHEQATAMGFTDDWPQTARAPEMVIPEVGLPVSVDGVARFG